MGVTQRATERSLESARLRAEQEVKALIDAALVVLRRDGAAGMTVADVLAEAGLSTRAFYRHFASKDELVLAVYERDAEATRRRLEAAMAAAPTPRAALEAWIDETLALGFRGGRAARTRPLARDGVRLQREHPDVFAEIVAGVIRPLVDVLAAGRASGAFPGTDPERDARSIHAVAWALVSDKLHGAAITADDARAHMLRFCLPALGAS